MYHYASINEINPVKLLTLREITTERQPTRGDISAYYEIRYCQIYLHVVSDTDFLRFIKTFRLRKLTSKWKNFIPFLKDKQYWSLSELLRVRQKSTYIKYEISFSHHFLQELTEDAFSAFWRFFQNITSVCIGQSSKITIKTENS